MIDSASPAPSHPTLGRHSHFVALDGLRGVAAGCVFMFHGLASSTLERSMFTSGLLMVDLFFLLSGFVIAHAYERPLQEDMGFSDFAVRRFVRLYPMIFLGAALAGAVGIFDLYFRQNSPLAMSGGELTTAIGLSFFLLPFTIGNPTPEIFPTNTVLWSLMFETIINLVYAVFARHLTTPRLCIIVALSLGTITIGGFGGGGIDNAWMGIPRVSAGFFGGVILYRWWRDGAIRLPAMPFSIASLLLLLVSLLPWPLPAAVYPPIFLLFSVIILSTAGRQAGDIERRICITLGALSYPLYVLHRPILSTILSLSRRVVGNGWPAVHITVAAALLICAILSHYAVRFYEGPARRSLGRRLRIGQRGPQDPETLQSSR